ncbi:MAG: hypothetical protein ACYC6Z_00015 [Thermoleophilia bacterium]
MNSGSYIVIIAIVAAAAGAASLMSKRMKQRRSEALRKDATLLGLDFTAEPERSSVAQIASGFELFQKGSRKGDPLNLLEGEASGLRVHCFDYSYFNETSSYSGGNYHHNESAQRLTVAIFELGPVTLPAFLLKKAGMADRIKDKLGMHDIDIPGFVQFSDEYWLQGDDPSRLQTFFGEDLAGAIAGHGLEKGEALEGRDSRLMFYARQTDAFTAFIRRAGEFAQMFASAAS